MSYMDEEGLTNLWEKSSANADHKTVFGFETIPMKTWNLMGGKCQKNEQLYVKSGKYKLTIENLKINGEMVPSDDPRNKIFISASSADSKEIQSPSSVCPAAGTSLRIKSLQIFITYSAFA